MKGSSNNLMGAGVVAAIAASLCCITPVIALIVGVGGIASAFSWLEPARPYMVVITVVALGLAWYQKLRANKIDCACEDGNKPSFLRSKSFLVAITVFASVMLAFPYYAQVFYQDVKASVASDSKNIRQVDLNIAGMTCTACEDHIKHAVSQLPGFISASADHKAGMATVTFDESKTTTEQIVSAVNESGYKVVDYKSITNKN
jgi:copper chaperone CopZ